MQVEPDIFDRLGAVLTRVGITRNSYAVTPGLYCVGSPDENSPVVVTANYKLTFDAVRFSSRGLHYWLLVVDTRGVNVWCAAGKGTFSTSEVVASVECSGITDVVKSKRLIVPQLCATGVDGLEVKKQCGFSVDFGPVNIGDLAEYLQNNRQASERMRSATFSLVERAVLIPVELYLKVIPLIIIFLTALLISGIGPEFFSFQESWRRGLLVLGASVTALIAGSVLVPLLLPWLFGRQFWIKGLWPPLLLAPLFLLSVDALIMESLALLLWLTAFSSYQAMLFTGCTPYTSPSGVEAEMRKGIPVQLVMGITAAVLWLIAPFTL